MTPSETHQPSTLKEGTSANDVEPQLYATVISEMIRHEIDMTNHRIMWPLIGQGLIANAYVSAGGERTDIVSVLAPFGILVALSAFVILYKSFQARGYLKFLWNQPKRGTLVEESLPLLGWPRKRTQGWHRAVWLCPRLGKASDLVEPYLFLPSLLILAWALCAGAALAEIGHRNSTSSRRAADGGHGFAAMRGLGLVANQGRAGVGRLAAPA